MSLTERQWNWLGIVLFGAITLAGLWNLATLR